MKLKKIGKKILFPHIALLLVLVPVSLVLLIYSPVFKGTKSVVTYISYAVSAYTLTVWCVRIPSIIRAYKKFKTENKYARRWFADARLRVNVSLYGSLLWNTAYAVFQLGLGFYHNTAWFYSLAAYYICLALMRFFLLAYTKKYEAGEKMKKELERYRFCGIMFLFMNIALTVMMFFRVFGDRNFYHHEITAIAIALYTFVTLIRAIVNLIKYRKFGSPVYTASKLITLAAACVSVINLESILLATFDDGTISVVQFRLMLGLSGGFVSAFIIGMAVFMIVQSSIKIKKLKRRKNKTMDNRETFNYTYSAKQQEEIKEIRKKYSVPQEERGIEKLRRLDSGVTKKASAVAFSLGIVGSLILGFGMSLIMTDLSVFFNLEFKSAVVIGVAVGVLGIVAVGLAYPVYNFTLKRERKKIAPEILRLTDELMK